MFFISTQLSERYILIFATLTYEIKVWITSLIWLQCICVSWCKPASVTNVLSHF